jgi:hypothetical protein
MAISQNKPEQLILIAVMIVVFLAFIRYDSEPRQHRYTKSFQFNTLAFRATQDFI